MAMMMMMMMAMMMMMVVMMLIITAGGRFSTALRPPSSNCSSDSFRAEHWCSRCWNPTEVVFIGTKI